MKLRTDFISNSSSCSFIISAKTDTLGPALKFFSDTFKDCCIPYDIGDKISISFDVKNRWFKDVYEIVCGEKCREWSDYYSDWKTGQMRKKDPDELCWDNGIDMGLDKLADCYGLPDVAEKIECIRFQCHDSDTAGIMYLRLLYEFFERNMFCPSAADSEHEFLTSNDDFMEKLTLTCRRIGESRGKIRKNDEIQNKNM